MLRLLIGYGNPLRCDDGVGWFLASQLAADINDRHTRIIAAHQLTPEMAEAVSQASEVLFLDAAVGEEPGMWAVSAVPPSLQLKLSALVHTLTPGALLGLSEALYGTAPPARIVTVTGADFGYGESFSEAVEAV
ncbi:MAG: hydrogenase maturation protease, partial [Anaerolineae bacterium]|nr:hydrogenase maturation protease [Anaerolineae bacterium]